MNAKEKLSKITALLEYTDFNDGSLKDTPHNSIAYILKNATAIITELNKAQRVGFADNGYLSEKAEKLFNEIKETNFYRFNTKE